jgi:hypothetical protein
MEIETQGKPRFCKFKNAIGLQPIRNHVGLRTQYQTNPWVKLLSVVRNGSARM